MLVLIPVINEKRIYKFYLPPLSLCIMSTVTTVLPQYLLVKDRQKPGHRFQVCTLFGPSSCAKLHVQTSGWTERFMQVHRHCMILDNVQISLNFLLHVSFDILTFFNQNIHKRIVLISEEMGSSFNNLHAACVYSLLQGLHT